MTLLCSTENIDDDDDDMTDFSNLSDDALSDLEGLGYFSDDSSMENPEFRAIGDYSEADSSFESDDVRSVEVDDLDDLTADSFEVIQFENDSKIDDSFMSEFDLELQALNTTEDDLNLNPEGIENIDIKPVVNGKTWRRETKEEVVKKGKIQRPTYVETPTIPSTLSVPSDWNLDDAIQQLPQRPAGFIDDDCHAFEVSVPSMSIGSIGEEINANSLNDEREGAPELIEMQGAIAWEMLEMCEQMFKDGKIGKYIVRRMKLGGN